MKDFSKISLCYYPTTLVIIDDNKDSALFTVTELLEEYDIPCYLYDKPYEALNFLNNDYKTELFINRSLMCDEDKSTFDNAIIKLDFASIYTEIYNPNRFSQINTLIIDYGMPGLNGAEFCDKLTNTTIKKIMLTGEADNDKAVTLFNNGKIDLFITKDTPDLFEKLYQMILQSQQKFFGELSQSLLNQYQKTFLTCLSDPAFIQLFNESYKKANAVECYLLDDQGSFLFLDKDAKPSWLIVANDEMMTGYYQFVYYNRNVPASVIDSLKEKTMLPFFPTGEALRPDVSEWENYLYPAEVLNAKDKYYFSFITEARIHNLELDRITSYQTYLDTTYQSYFDKFLEV